MANVTVTFETYNPDHGVVHTRVTGTYLNIVLQADILSAATDTFCIRTADGVLCECDRWGIRK